MFLFFSFRCALDDSTREDNVPLKRDLASTEHRAHRPRGLLLPFFFSLTRPGKSARGPNKQHPMNEPPPNYLRPFVPRARRRNGASGLIVYGLQDWACSFLCVLQVLRSRSPFFIAKAVGYGGQVKLRHFVHPTQPAFLFSLENSLPPGSNVVSCPI